MTVTFEISCEDTLLYFIESLPQEAVDEICTQGANDCAVTEWLDAFDMVFDLKWASKYLESIGVENAKNMSNKEIKSYLLWVAAWNTFDNQ